MEGDRGVAEQQGIIPNSFAHIFGHICKSEGEAQFLVRVSYLELYNEEVRDILSKTPQKKLEVRERSDIGVYVKDLSNFVVRNADDMFKLIAIGNKNRSFAATDMNVHSSRSHVIFTTTIERSDLGKDNQKHLRMGKLHLVDLAGSERQSKTHSEGAQFSEAVKINQSLSSLGNVISALVNGRCSHVPYRNSKLTRLLQDSLGGNSKTVMIANVGPADYNADETLNTLRYANRAKNIKNHAHINEDPKDAMLRDFQKEIDDLKKLLEEGGEEESDAEEVSDERKTSRRKEGKKRKLSQKRSSVTLSPQIMATMKEQIEIEKAELFATKDLAEGEKNKAELALHKREQELKAAQDQYSDLEEKLTELNSQVIHGGVNLLEQAEEQEQLLESSARELEKRTKEEEVLKQQLNEKEAEEHDMEEKYATLQEEAVGKTRILKEVWKQFQHAKEEIADMKVEAQRENEDLLDMIRELSKEVKLQTLIINMNVPQDYQKNLEENVEWHEETGEWHMPGLAYAGNNVKVDLTTQQPFSWVDYDTSQAYLSYKVDPYDFQTLSELHSNNTGTGVSMKLKSCSKPVWSTDIKNEGGYPASRGHFPGKRFA